MRVALRVLAITNIAQAVATALLDVWLINHDDTALDIVLLLVVALGFTLACPTVIIGFIGAAQGRQFGWLIGLIGAVALTIGAPFLARMISLQLAPPPITDPACYAPVVPVSCQATFAQLIIQNLPLLAIAASPAIVGLVAFPYSFRLKTR